MNILITDPAQFEPILTKFDKRGIGDRVRVLAVRCIFGPRMISERVYLIDNKAANDS